MSLQTYKLGPLGPRLWIKLNNYENKFWGKSQIIYVLMLLNFITISVDVIAKLELREPTCESQFRSVHIIRRRAAFITGQQAEECVVYYNPPVVILH